MNKETNKIKTHKEYIKKYILPNEPPEIKELYYNNSLEYDKEYIEEHIKYNTLIDYIIKE